MRTWMYELAFATPVMSATFLLSAGGKVEIFGFSAVLLSFAHMQVSDRMAEAEVRRYGRDDQTLRADAVRCHLWSRRYLVLKELCWLVYFIALGAWTALVGVALFLGYPAWRSFWRSRNPL